MLKSIDLMRLIEGRNFVIATDFDDTLVHTDKYPVIGEQTRWFGYLKHLQEKFPKLQVILWTCRSDSALDAAVRYCKNNGLRIDAVNEDVQSSLAWKPKTAKPFAHIYVDDRAVCALSEIDKMMGRIENGTT